MVEEGAPGVPSIKPLASWKTWWGGTTVAYDVAKSIQKHIDPSQVPGKGCLVKLKTPGKVTAPDLQDPHTARVVEGMLQSYPSEKDPSGYCLGDAVLHLNINMANVILGPERTNPVCEKGRRDAALVQGTLLKKLLSYVRSSSARHEKGRSPTTTFLKELALLKGRPSRGKSSSPASTCSTRSAATLILGEDPSSDGSPFGSVVEILGVKEVTKCFVSVWKTRQDIGQQKPMLKSISSLGEALLHTWLSLIRTKCQPPLTTVLRTVRQLDEMDVIGQTLVLLGWLGV